MAIFLLKFSADSLSMNIHVFFSCFFTTEIFMCLFKCCCPNLSWNNTQHMLHVLYYCSKIWKVRNFKSHLGPRVLSKNCGLIPSIRPIRKGWENAFPALILPSFLQGFFGLNIAIWDKIHLVTWQLIFFLGLQY